MNFCICTLDNKVPDTFEIKSMKKTKSKFQIFTTPRAFNEFKHVK